VWCGIGCFTVYFPGRDIVERFQRNKHRNNLVSARRGRSGRKSVSTRMLFRYAYFNEYM